MSGECTASRNFSRLVGASGASNLADGVFVTALPLVALTLTREPAVFAGVALVGRLPWLLFALPAGAFADRLDRRRTMSLVNAARALIIGGLATVLAAGRAELWILYVVAFALGTGETLFDTAAQSILPSVVDQRALDRANSRLYAVELTANQFVGPPLGAIVAGATLAGAMTISAGMYVLAGITLLTLTGKFRPQRTGPPTSVWTDVREGVHYLVGHRLLRVLAMCTGVSNLGSTAMMAILPLYLVAPGPGGLSEAGYGFLLASFALGSVLGTLLVEPIRRRLGAWGTLMVAVTSFPLFSLVPALTTSAPVLAAGFVISAAFSIGWNVVTVSLRQRIVPDHLLGRVNAGYRLVAWGAMPLGAGLGGVTASVLGLVPALFVAASISAVCIPIVLFGASPAALNPARPIPPTTEHSTGA